MMNGMFYVKLRKNLVELKESKIFSKETVNQMLDSAKDLSHDKVYPVLAIDRVTSTEIDQIEYLTLYHIADDNGDLIWAFAPLFKFVGLANKK
ncbi:MAG: hypothetical protein ACLFR1_15770 [Spirochaetia bacterium]